MSKIALYMSGSEPDMLGRFISEIHQYSHFWLEHDHKFVQVLFPIDSGHKFNRHAPLVMQEDIDIFLASSELRQVQLRSLDLMLDYYGFERQGDMIIERDDLTIQTHNWLKPKNHNHLRISRIIRSLYLLGNESVAREVQKAFAHAARRIGTISEETIAHWEKATS